MPNELLLMTGWAGVDCKTRDLRPCTKGCAAFDHPPLLDRSRYQPLLSRTARQHGLQCVTHVHWCAQHEGQPQRSAKRRLASLQRRRLDRVSMRRRVLASFNHAHVNNALFNPSARPVFTTERCFKRI